MAIITFYYATMGAGKSTYALQLDHSLDQAGFRPLLVKPKMDVRDTGVIRSRIGIEKECVQLDADELDLYMTTVPDTTHVIFDEAQFYSHRDIELICYELDARNVPGYFFGLRTAFTGYLFEGSAALMALADNLIELPLMYRDGNKTVMHVRYIDGKPVFDGDPIHVGDLSEDYESVSRQHYFRMRELHG